ncbi:hypothetical protein B0H14DRAFT_2568612 [Mycena olivaceomarginata]|nr:hypothetical protein B0H14DRAFT_2568612 [Mycena olivaceomarginata]
MRRRRPLFLPRQCQTLIFIPSCGPNASTQDGGGKPKVTAQWELAVLLLGKMDEYRDAIEACDTPKKKLVYANKIKNRIGTYVQCVTKINAHPPFYVNSGPNSFKQDYSMNFK